MFFLFSLQLINVYGQSSDIRFSHVSVEDGLSQNSVNCMIQDRAGYLWIGTQDGLNRYDGYDFKIFRPEANNQNSLSHRIVHALCQDDDGILWIGTRDGLNRFDPITNQFVRYYNDPEDSASLSYDYVVSLLVDKQGVLWVGTYGGGLNRYNRKTDTFAHFFHNPENSYSLSHNAVKVIFEDSAGRMWLGTATGGNGVNLFDRKQNRFYNARNTPSLGCLDMRSINAIIEDEKGYLWIGSWHHGLLHFDPETNAYKRYLTQNDNDSNLDHNNVLTLKLDPFKNLWIGLSDGGLKKVVPVKQKNELTTVLNAGFRFEDYLQDESDPFGLYSNRINCLYLDHSGNLWIGTMDNGINKVNLYQKPFRHSVSDANDPNRLLNSNLSAIVEDDEGRLWIATRGDGLNCYDTQKHALKNYKHDSDNPNSIAFDDVIALCWDPAGTIWIGYGNRGLDRLDVKNQQFFHYQHETNDSTSLSSDSVHELYLDRQGSLWIGTYGGGACRYNRETDTFTPYFVFPSKGRRNAVLAFNDDAAGNFWMGTPDLGLIRLDRKTDQLEFIKLVGLSEASINQLQIIFQSKDGDLWIGTNGAGLLKYDVETNEIKKYTKSEGLPNNMIHGILEDDQGNLWISTEQGLSKFSPSTEKFRNYDVYDGLQSNIFRLQVALKRADGTLFFGGDNGLTRFHPDSILDRNVLPEIVITDVRLFNKSIFSSSARQDYQDSALNENSGSHLTLSHDENFLSFEFSALHFDASEKNRYRYILKNFDKEWTDTDSEHRLATYTNLNPGRYTFSVIGSNNDGYWNHSGASLTIFIRPPFWKTRWFQFFAIVLTVGILFAYYRNRTHTMRKRSQELERINEELNEQIKSREQTENKLRKSLLEKSILLNEIHHRVKNNLQVINSLLSLQSENIQDPEVRVMFQESQHRVLSMALVHEKLYQSEDFAHINFSEYISGLVARLIGAYPVITEPIRTQVKVEEDVNITVDYAVPCGLIINELVSNAIKHGFPPEYKQTPEISVSFRKKKDFWVELIIKDNGVGLPDGFDSNATDTLGLQLVKTLTKVQLKGELQIVNNSGVTCVVQFRVKQDGG